MSWAHFERKITTLKNNPTPLFEEPLKFIVHGHIFERLLYAHIVASEQLGGSLAVRWLTVSWIVPKVITELS